MAKAVMKMFFDNKKMSETFIFYSQKQGMSIFFSIFVFDFIRRVMDIKKAFEVAFNRKGKELGKDIRGGGYSRHHLAGIV